MNNSKDKINDLKIYFVITALILLSRYLITSLSLVWLNVTMGIMYMLSKIIGLLLLSRLLDQDYDLLEFTKHVYFFNMAYFDINYLLDYILLGAGHMSLIYIVFLYLYLFMY